MKDNPISETNAIIYFSMCAYDCEYNIKTTTKLVRTAPIIKGILNNILSAIAAPRTSAK